MSILKGFGEELAIWNTDDIHISFYFQAALNQSPRKGSDSYMFLAVPQIIGLIAGGGITTAIEQDVRPFICTEASCRRPEYQMPVMLVAHVLCGVEAASLTTLSSYKSTTLRPTFIALTVLRIGLGIKTKHMEIQAVLKT